jgi:hypothetical protein
MGIKDGLSTPHFFPSDNFNSLATGYFPAVALLRITIHLRRRRLSEITGRYPFDQV